MINPGEIVGYKIRIYLEVIVKIAKIKPDTFVYFCRDFGLSAGEISLLVNHYYKISPEDSKKTAFASAAWGDRTAAMIQNSDAAFDYLKEQNSIDHQK